MIDEYYMRRCISLAKLANGNVAPNPMVGAVLVFENRIIGEGYHQQYGEAHAEVNCIASVTEEDKKLIKDTTLYVSLEPCDHFGKTPPCTGLILENKIKKVRIGCRDIFEQVNGKGISKLKSAGVDVISGILEKECYDLNKRFFTYHKEKRPYIILKWAQTVNGVMGKKGSVLSISNGYTKRLVHKWRSEEAAILIGYNTALNDDPQLTNRYWYGTQPMRIVLARNGNLPAHLHLLNDENKTIIFNMEKNTVEKNCKFIQVSEKNYLKEVLQMLFQLKIMSVIVEGGSKTLQMFFDEKVWDECRIITNTEMTDEGISSPLISKMRLVKTEQILNDHINYYQKDWL